MEPLIKEKRICAAFIPYRKTEGRMEFYLQKRDANAPVHAHMFSVFGGGIEGEEDILAVLRREIFEELNYEPGNPVYFSKFETSRSVFHVFIEEVDDTFESLVKVSEGEYGAFLPFERIDRSKDVSDIAEMVTRAMCTYVSK